MQLLHLTHVVIAPLITKSLMFVLESACCHALQPLPQLLRSMPHDSGFKFKSSPLRIRKLAGCIADESLNQCSRGNSVNQKR